jgi:CRISPR/Cas system-associated exonuclease Cas4 (RecB family)
MNFTHVDLNLPELKRETIDGVRYYTINNENKKLVSITSVISHYKKDFFDKWRKRVGVEEANKITKRATSRGTDTHTLIENYLLNQELPEVQPISDMLFKIAKPTIDRINNIHCLESSLYSEVLGVAGTTDCLESSLYSEVLGVAGSVDTIAEFDGELAVIDYKTSKEPKPVEWIEGYFVQTMFYGMALYEMTGLEIKKLVIIMTCENGECVVYEERDLQKYMKLVIKYIRKFVNDKLNH